jgi:hypothetical protein
MQAEGKLLHESAQKKLDYEANSTLFCILAGEKI